MTAKLRRWEIAVGGCLFVLLYLLASGMLTDLWGVVVALLRRH